MQVAEAPLQYQYLQVLPQLAKGENNTFWVIPSEVTSALSGVSRAFTDHLCAIPGTPADVTDGLAAQAAKDTARADEAAAAAVADAAVTSTTATWPTPRDAVVMERPPSAG